MARQQWVSGVEPALRLGEEQQQREREAHGRGEAELVAQEGKHQRRRRKRAVERPGLDPKVCAGDEEGELNGGDGQRLDQAELAALARPDEACGKAEQEREGAGRERVLGRADEQEAGPKEAQQHRRGGEPGPAAPPGDGEQRDVEQREVSEQRQRAFIAVADQCRREEAADQAHDRGRRAVAKRHDERGHGHRDHRRRGGAGADQLVEDISGVGRRVEDGEARARQHLGDARLVREARGARIFAQGDQQQAEDRGADHPRRRSDQPDLDRIADEEDSGDEQGRAADPDQQAAGDPALEQAAQTLVPRGLGFRLGLGFRNTLRFR